MDGGLPFPLGKFLLIAGVILVVLGLLVMAGSKLSFFGLGRLPGDLAVRGKHTTFYFPLVTCLIVSAVVTLVLWVMAFLTRR